VSSPAYLWFAWRPVRLGALGTDRLVWLRTVLRVPGPGGIDIYQPKELLRAGVK
jgi:hypothetical protein